MHQQYSVAVAVVLIASAVCTIDFSSSQNMLFDLLNHHRPSEGGHTTTGPPSGADTPKCCVPQQWEALLSTYSTHTHSRMVAAEVFGLNDTTINPHDVDDTENIKSSFSYISYDAQNKRVAATEFYPIANLKAIYDFRKERAFYIHGERCVSFNLLKGFNPMCIPGKAKFSNEFSLGYKNNKLDFNSFSMDIQGHDRNRVNLFLAATPGDCMFISSTAMGSVHRRAFVAGTSVLNATSGIHDPSVFNPPSICQTADDDSGVEAFNLFNYVLPSQL